MGPAGRWRRSTISTDVTSRRDAHLHPCQLSIGSPLRLLMGPDDMMEEERV